MRLAAVQSVNTERMSIIGLVSLHQPNDVRAENASGQSEHSHSFPPVIQYLGFFLSRIGNSYTPFKHVFFTNNMTMFHLREHGCIGVSLRCVLNEFALDIII